jgi:nitroimidazol reductase NimA-like FMN-containing flavoprotein (pyridoxamine 5'-phosphate oxidase superfamily)
MNLTMTTALLTSAPVGRLACARNGQPYVTPFSFAYRDGFLYGFATVGMKIEWMRENPLVCVEVDSVVSREAWRSAVIFGRYQELPDTPELSSARRFAHELLSRTAMWWDPGLSGPPGAGAMPRQPIFFRIAITDISGRQGVPDQPNP